MLRYILWLLLVVGVPLACVAWQWWRVNHDDHA